MKKIITKLGCFFIHNGFHKATFLKKMNVFGSFGEKCFWHPRILPSEPEKFLLEIMLRLQQMCIFAHMI